MESDRLLAALRITWSSSAKVELMRLLESGCEWYEMLMASSPFYNLKARLRSEAVISESTCPPSTKDYALPYLGVCGCVLLAGVSSQLQQGPSIRPWLRQLADSFSRISSIITGLGMDLAFRKEDSFVPRQEHNLAIK